MANKGSPFERLMSKTLSLWLSDGAHEDWIWRSTSSGARATTRAKKGKDTAASHGDLTHLDPRGIPFVGKVCVECKRGYGSWSVMDVIDKAPSAAKQPFEKMWEQVTRDASFDDRRRMLLFKKDRRVAALVIDADFKTWVEGFCGKLRGPYMSLWYGEEKLYIMSLENFMAWCRPEIFNK